MAQDNRLLGMDTRYVARTFKIEVYINTDASMREIKERALAVQAAARGTRNDMVVTAVGEVPAEQAEQAEPLWAAVRSAANEIVGEKKS